MRDMTLVNLLDDRASQHPDKVAYTFLDDGEREVSSLTYQQLDEKARAIAAYLQAQLKIGDRVLLVYPQGLEAIAALFGCLYAGMIAIPAPAPETARLKRTLPRLEAIASDIAKRDLFKHDSFLEWSESSNCFIRDWRYGNNLQG